MHYRQQTQLPQTRLADWMGISVPTYRLTESGGRQAQTAEINAFAEFSGIPLSMLTDETQALPQPLPTPPPFTPTPRGRPQKGSDPFTPQSQLLKRLHQYVATAPHLMGNQRLLAQALQMDEGQLSKYVTGKREITQKMILRFARKLGISADWLRSGLGSPADHYRSTSQVCHDGDRLTEYLHRNGLDFTALHEAMGHRAYRSTYSYKLRRTIRHETRQKIADALQVSVQDIFGC